MVLGATIGDYAAAVCIATAVVGWFVVFTHYPTKYMYKPPGAVLGADRPFVKGLVRETKV